MAAGSHHDDAAQVLSIGIIRGGPNPSPWHAPIMGLMNHVVSARDGVESPLNVNVIFQVPGSVLVPDFEGVRTGYFRRRDSHLIVQVAVPPEAPPDPDAYVRARLRDVFEVVVEWNARRNRRFDLSALEAVIGKVSGDERRSNPGFEQNAAR